MWAGQGEAADEPAIRRLQSRRTVERRSRPPADLLSALATPCASAAASGSAGRERPARKGRSGRYRLRRKASVQLATVDMTPADIEEFYSGFANQALWPVFHYRVDLAQFRPAICGGLLAHQRADRRAGCGRCCKPDDLVWVHDYHFMPLGEQIRADGFAGPIGFFLHIPFPPPEIFTALPDAHRLVAAMLSYDVIGFQTCDRSRQFRALRALRAWRIEVGRRLDGGPGQSRARRRVPDRHRRRSLRELRQERRGARPPGADPRAPALAANSSSASTGWIIPRVFRSGFRAFERMLED